MKKPTMTQLAPTPTAVGEYAKQILEEMGKKPTAKQKKMAAERDKFFKSIPRRGIR
jgi:hypothetical protein